MTRSNWVVVAFGALAAAATYATAVVFAGAGHNGLAAPLVAVAVAGAFGWTRRDRDVLEVFVPSFFVAYAAYVGIAVARVPHLTVTARDTWPLGPLVNLGPLSGQWPIVLVGGVVAALILTIAVALPVSMIPVRRHVDAHANDALWSFVEERNARTATERRPVPPPGTPPAAPGS